LVVSASIFWGKERCLKRRDRNWLLYSAVRVGIGYRLPDPYMRSALYRAYLPEQVLGSLISTRVHESYHELLSIAAIEL
jgi:hypothetical protein